MNQPTQSQAQALPPFTLRDWDRADMLGAIESLRGRRVILVNGEGSHHDFRAWSDLRPSAGALVVDVVSEVAWWRHVNLAMRPPEVLRWPARAVWVEV